MTRQFQRLAEQTDAERPASVFTVSYYVPVWHRVYDKATFDWRKRITYYLATRAVTEV